MGEEIVKFVKNGKATSRVRKIVKELKARDKCKENAPSVKINWYTWFSIYYIFLSNSLTNGLWLREHPKKFKIAHFIMNFYKSRWHNIRK